MTASEIRALLAAVERLEAKIDALTAQVARTPDTDREGDR